MAENTTTKIASIADVQKDVGTDPVKAYKAMRAEREADKPRTKLIDHLEGVVRDAAELPSWAANGSTNKEGARYQVPGSTIELLASTKAYKNGVRKFVEQHQTENGGVRVYTTDGAPLRQLSEAFAQAANELFEQQSDYRRLIRSSKIAAAVADTADAFEPGEESAPKKRTAKAEPTAAKKTAAKKTAAKKTATKKATKTAAEKPAAQKAAKVEPPKEAVA